MRSVAIGRAAGKRRETQDRLEVQAPLWYPIAITRQAVSAALHQVAPNSSGKARHPSGSRTVLFLPFVGIRR
jgi:hypothetical protein